VAGGAGFDQQDRRVDWMVELSVRGREFQAFLSAPSTKP
jgi:hypothetical protein